MLAFLAIPALRAARNLVFMVVRKAKQIRVDVKFVATATGDMIF
jgi:hypothetical protein